MSIQNIKKFGPQEIKLLFALEQKKVPIFTIADARQILVNSDASVKNVLKRLKKKRRIIPLQKGTYLFAPLRSGEEGLWTEDAFRIVPYLTKTNEYYVGFTTAMNYWGMTEQLPLTIHIISKKQKQGINAVDTKYIFVKKKHLGDYIAVSFAGTQVNISTIEQTILDALALPEYCGGVEGATKAMWYARNKVDWDKLLSLAGHDKNVVQRRLGYLLDILGFKKYSTGLERIFSGFSWLEPKGQKHDFKYDKKWGLKINVKKEDLLEFQRGY